MTKVSHIAALLDVDREHLSMLQGHSPEDLTALAAAIEAAQTREESRVNEGIEQTLGVIPRPLRGRARALIFPKDDA